jgi:hypothetical protein
MRFITLLTSCFILFTLALAEDQPLDRRDAPITFPLKRAKSLHARDLPITFPLKRAKSLHARDLPITFPLKRAKSLHARDLPITFPLKRAKTLRARAIAQEFLELEARYPGFISRIKDKVKAKISGGSKPARKHPPFFLARSTGSIS